MDLESILTRIRSENQQHRETQDARISRCVSAIGKGDYDDVGIVLDEITGTVREGVESGAGTLEAGDADGSSGSAVTAASPA